MIKQLHITQLVGGYDNNFSYFISDGKSKDVAIVDPSFASDIIKKIQSEGWNPKMIFLTHSHLDHTAGAAELVNKYDIPVYMHENAADRVEVPKDSMKFVDDGDEIMVGDLKIEVLYTPGHIDDALCFYIIDKGNDAPKLITGDTLFVEGCGHVKLAGSDINELYETLQRLKKLPDEVEIHSGHDYGSKPVSTIAWEKEHNKFFLCKNFEKFKRLRL